MHNGGGGDDAVSRVSMEILEIDRRYADVAGHGNLFYSGSKNSSSPVVDGQRQIQTASRFEHSDFPEANGGNGNEVVSKRGVNELPGLLAQTLISINKPDESMCVQKNWHCLSKRVPINVNGRDDVALDGGGAFQ